MTPPVHEPRPGAAIDPAREDVVAEAPAPGGRRSLVSVVAPLTFVNVVVTSFGIVTGPLLGRALGPTGRGDLAAILVPFAQAPWILSLGVPTYAGWKAAVSRSLGAVVGTVCVLSLVLGLVGAALAVPLASLFAQGRDTVYTFLLVGFLLLPPIVAGYALNGVANGLEMWRVVVISRLISPLVGVAGIVTLFVLDELTVARAALITICGSVLGLAPTLRVLRRVSDLRFERRLAREAVSFGSKAWANTVAQLANNRLDQLVMIPLVEPHELGLYAVAVTLASASGVLSGALGPALLPRIAQGDREIAGRSTRVMLAATAFMNLGLAALSPWLLPGLFGSDFDGAVPMAWILLGAELPSVVAVSLGAAITSAGRPGPSATAQFIGLAVTIPGLFALLPPLGGEGAAIVSLLAYSASCGYLLTVAVRHFGGTVRDFTVIRREDVEWGRRQLRRRIRPST